MQYVSIKEISKKWGICARRVCTLCNQGRIEGAFKKVIWLIPSDAKEPIRKT